MRQKRFNFTAIFLGVIVFLFWPQHVFAETVINLPATPIAQRFSPADLNGDTGVHNCMAAALTTALLILADGGNLSIERDMITYPNIRYMLRSWSPNTRVGIQPEVLQVATPIITKGEYGFAKRYVSPSAWKVFLKTELTSSRPVIVHMADRHALYNPASQAAASHVIVVYGMDEETVSFTDSWDGVSHVVSHTIFANAWGKGHYNWLAFVFVSHNS